MILKYSSKTLISNVDLISAKKETLTNPEDKLKIIHTLFGDKYPTGDVNKPNFIYGEVLNFLKKSKIKEDIHFVLGAHNRDFLLENGVLENNIILVENPTNDLKGFSYFYKTFLLNCAAEMFRHNSVLFLDYDCHPIRDFDKKDVYFILEKNKNRDIQCPPVGYKRKLFKSIDNSCQRHGLQSNIIYWRDPSIIKKWFDNHVKNINVSPDEYSLLLTLEGMYGKLLYKDLYDFDTPIIYNKRRPKIPGLYCAENYKDAYFWHG